MHGSHQTSIQEPINQINVSITSKFENYIQYALKFIGFIALASVPLSGVYILLAN